MLIGEELINQKKAKEFLVGKLLQVREDNNELVNVLSTLVNEHEQVGLV